MTFFPADRPIPDTLRTPTFVLRPLNVAVASIDYEAYMASPDVIRVHSGGRWPVDGFTLEDERRELTEHERRHRERRDFAFVLLTPDEATGLGCVYILPLLPFLRRYAANNARLLAQSTDASAIVTFWLRQDQQQTSLAADVITAVHQWLLADWPFDDHVFRVNQAEHASIRALEQCGFGVRFSLPTGETSAPYLFWRKIGN
jgi:RimJ/RimL family protein N-acetyltransferase